MECLDLFLTIIKNFVLVMFVTALCLWATDQGPGKTIAKLLDVAIVMGFLALITKTVVEIWS